MRCKNCGCENDDNLYICQNCGSPLYDENGEIQGNSEQGTQVFNAVGANEYDDYEDEELKRRREEREIRRAEKQAAAQKKKKQEIIIIVVLAILLVAIIIGTVIAIAHSKNKEQTTLSTVSSTSTTVETTDDTTATTTTTTTTTTETTTEETTVETTQTTKPTQYNINVSCNEGGEVEGPSSAEKGSKVTVIARPSDGYDFAGWYNGGSFVSANTSYSFTATNDTSLSAKFVPMENNGGNDIIDGADD